MLKLKIGEDIYSIMHYQDGVNELDAKAELQITLNEEFFQVENIISGLKNNEKFILIEDTTGETVIEYNKKGTIVVLRNYNSDLNEKSVVVRMNCSL